MRNVERANDSIGYRLLEVGVFRSYESINSSARDLTFLLSFFTRKLPTNDEGYIC